MKVLPQVVFVVPPTVYLLDLAGPVQVFQEAVFQGQPYQLRYCSYQETVVSSPGLGLGPLLSFEQVPIAPGDFIMVAGLEMAYLRSAAFRREGQALFAWLRTQQALGARIGSICTGAFVLAEAGLLDGRKCTTHWRRLAELQARYPRVRSQGDTLFVEDGGIYTSAGVTSGIDLALYLLEEAHGPRFATQVARGLVVYSRRGAQHGQQSIYLNYRRHVHAGIHHVQDWLGEHLAVGATLPMLADVVGMSPRTLTRTFRQATGITIQAYTTALRREVADTLSRNPAQTMEAIAAQCGFKNVRQLQRIWARPKPGGGHAPAG
ncbi:GlxA family transcriptional regulator [Hymenobacter sp. BT730]|uniref:GlxA family transcriptional regulator n=1 Tax=Hymenobacter sp. BT730 TaxID=3063332 RepID=UPI0026DF8349|nr:DJ-1/PfpI family protein [Hymenobacter sp. BT730]